MHVHVESRVLELMIDECDSGLARSRLVFEHEDKELEDWTSEINSQILTSSDYVTIISSKKKFNY